MQRLEGNGITGADIKKLVEAGFYTVERFAFQCWLPLTVVAVLPTLLRRHFLLSKVFRRLKLISLRMKRQSLFPLVSQVQVNITNKESN